MPRQTGTVARFLNDKGFGFIKPDGATRNTKEVFVHYSAISMDGFKSLEPGERVEYDVVDDPKGLKAQNVVRV